MTLIELTLSMIILGTMAMVIAVMFREAIIANKLCRKETTILTNVRKAIHGDGPIRGLLFDALYASSTTSLGSATLATASPDVAITTWSLSSSDLQRAEGSTTTTLATGVLSFGCSYYTLYATGTIRPATVASDSRLVTFSFSAKPGGGTLTFYSGGNLRNHP